MIKKLTIVLGVVALLVMIFCGAAYYCLVWRPLPLTDGELSLKGLRAPVNVLRDRWGVPHIYAENEHDLFMAQGYVQAQDRIWQMEANRRLASGRLSELLGEQTLDLDRLLRTLGFLRAAKEEVAGYDPETRALLEAYCEGVNGFLETQAGRLPLEFTLLDLTPEPWRPEDSVAWAKVMAFLGSQNWQEEIVRAMLSKKLGQDKARDLLGRIGSAAPPTVPGAFFPGSLRAQGGLPSVDMLPALGGASNNWSVHGSRTDTGLPILANDMHLELRIPSVWYEMHLSGGGLDVIGLSLPGVPLVIAGHNRDLAWGITFAYIDNQDLYMERMRPDMEGTYLYRGQWLKAQLIEEKIRIKGKAPILHKVWVTKHGPILPKPAPDAVSGGIALALEWSAHRPGTMVPGLYRINRADTWDAFKVAAQEWCEPSLNLVYADRKGNIGYILASRIPIRKAGHGNGPFPGWTGENEWIGYVVPVEKPFLFNPPNGFVATANNRVAGPDYPYYLSEDFTPGYRAARIRQVLTEKDRVSKTDCRQLQADLKCPPADAFLSVIAGMAGKTPETRDLLSILGDWDRSMGPDSVGGAVYAVLFYRILENTFRDDLGPLTDSFFGIGMTLLRPLNRFSGHSRVILLSLMAEPDSPWFDDIRSPAVENLSDILEKSLAETRAFLIDRLGPDPGGWRWGRLHTVEFRHPLGQVKPLDRIFNLGPYEGGGHFATVNQSAVRPGMDFSLNGWGVSNRHIYDLKDWDLSLGAIVPGQSGMFGSAHYSDQVAPWLAAGHHPLLFSESKIGPEVTESLLLLPASATHN